MGNSLTVFLIEDDEQILFMLNDFIKSRFPHFIVRTFVNGENALEAINEMPHVIVLDYFLNSKEPDASNGLAVLAKIRANNKITRVILLSSQEDPSVAASAIKMGAYDYIAKNEESFLKIENILLHYEKHIMVHSDIINRKLVMIFAGVSVLFIVVYLLFKCL
jgi:DNA-binding NtrC family response regulator